MARMAILVAVLLAGCGGAEIAAPAPAHPTGTLAVLSDSNRLTTIDVATGRRATRRVRSLPPCSGELFVTGGHIVFSAVVKGATTVYSIPLALDRRPLKLGTAHAFVPSPTDGRVWLAGTDCDREAMIGVREVTVDGRVTSESDRRVPGHWVAAAVPDGLVVSGDRELFVWDPRTGRTVSSLPLEMAFGAHGSLLTGCAEGMDCQALAVVDTATGRTVAVRGQVDPDAAFSPDGSTLATAVMRERRFSAALVDPRTGAPTPIAGSTARDWYPDLAWSRSGWLFIRAGARVKAYYPGAARAQLLPIRLPRSTIAFTAG